VPLTVDGKMVAIVDRWYGKQIAWRIRPAARTVRSGR
jgi:hypothetical protein